MKTVKKLLALLLAMVMILGMLPLGTLAQENGHDHLEGCTGEDCTAEGCTCRCHYRHLDTCLEGCTGTLAEGEACECDCHFVHLETCLADCTGTVEVDGQQQECACECHDHIEECVENCVGETKDGEACACSCHHTVESCTLDCAGEDCDCVCHEAAALNLEKPAPENKCATCGSTEHTTENHPKEEPKDETKCATCNSTEHTTENHPKEEPKDETKCATCNSTEHTTENHPKEEPKDETKCATCNSTEHTTENHPADVTKCGICGGDHADVDCTLCLFCKKEPCVCVVCEECGVKNDHTSTCTKRPCETCKKNPCECACETCGKFPCECPEVCEHCGVELVDGAKHKEDCLSLCTCEEGFKVHGSKCPLADGQEIFAYYEQELSKLAEESKTIASGLDKNADDYADKLKKLLDDYTAKLMECYGDSYYYYEDDVFTADQDGELLAIVEGVLAYLNEEFGYDYQTGILVSKSLLESLNAAKTLIEYNNALKNVNVETVDLGSIQWGDVNTHLVKAYGLYAKAPDEGNNKAQIKAVSEKLYAIRDRIEKDALQPATDISTIDGIVENDNVNIHLFNYGAGINTQQSDMGFLPFGQASYQTYKRNAFVYKNDKNEYKVSYEDMSEMDGEADANASSPTLRKTLVNGYPYVTKDWGYSTAGNKLDTALIKTGSLKYLFDKNQSNASGDTGYSVWNNAALITNPDDRTSNTGYTYNSNNSYAVRHYAAKAGDSHLFKDADGYYYYNSIENAAWFNKETSQFEVYNTTVIPKYISYRTNKSGTTGNFLPFNKISADTVGKVSDLAKLKEPVTKDDGKTTYESIVRPWTETNAADVYLLLEDDDSRIDLWFGISADFSFAMPKDGYQDGQQMVYEFFGDDDVFVYIDGVLILSIGGCHAPFNGSINFATGDVMYEQIKNYNTPAKENETRDTKEVIRTNLKQLYTDAYASLSDDEKASPMGLKIKRVLDNGFVAKTIDGQTKYIFKDYTRHDFNFFYLERGGNISAMKMKFNMEPIPSADVTLTKEVDNKNSAIKDNLEYTFSVTAKDADENALTSINYYIDEDGQQGTDLKTLEPNEDSQFVLKLKEGQTARFDGIEAGVRMSVTEVVDSTVTSKTKWTMDGSEYNAGTEFTVSPGVGIGLNCTNTRITGGLSIEKYMDGIHCAPEDKFPMKITIGNTPYTGAVTITKEQETIREDRALANTPGVFLLKTGETLTVSGIPTEYTYTVEELDPNNIDGNSAYGYLYKQEDTDTRKEYPLYDNATGTITADNTSAVKVTNKHVVADLKIIKNVNVPDVDAGQSFLFLVEGPAGYKQHVVIQGSGSKAITKLPVGEYTVTELTDWSWRYELDHENSITLLTGTGMQIDGSKVSFQLTRANEAVTFKNVRNETLWLDGNAYCDNAFTG